jgi:hypothetical protein
MAAQASAHVHREENIRVCVRVRPLASLEAAKGAAVVSVASRQELQVGEACAYSRAALRLQCARAQVKAPTPQNAVTVKNYTFDNVFGAEVTQVRVPDAQLVCIRDTTDRRTDKQTSILTYTSVRISHNDTLVHTG